MPRVIFTVDEQEKELWVEAAWNERVSLSEWLRRAANDRAQNGAGGLTAGVPDTSAQDESTARKSSTSPAPAASPMTASLGVPSPDEMIVSAGLPPAEPSPPQKRRRSAPRASMCEHRVPAGSYCRKCDS